MTASSMCLILLNYAIDVVCSILFVKQRARWHLCPIKQQLAISQQAKQRSNRHNIYCVSTMRPTTRAHLLVENDNLNTKTDQTHYQCDNWQITTGNWWNTASCHNGLRPVRFSIPYIIHMKATCSLWQWTGWHYRRFDGFQTHRGQGNPI